MRRRGGKRPEELITASEIACWAYCPEQWRLSYGLGHRPAAASRQAFAVGKRHHAEKATVERLASGAVNAGHKLTITAAVALVVLLVLLLAWVLFR